MIKLTAFLLLLSTPISLYYPRESPKLQVGIEFRLSKHVALTFFHQIKKKSIASSMLISTSNIDNSPRARHSKPVCFRSVRLK